ncbi:hypothetical protein BKA67DRAFT_662099 [Truncatella angustata]|uniref:Uncharacterized protein n=1 Tax=Truncatella angustata TaxID=152316 RepID=A0A9P8UFT3_9PEZI|nr:uncharacterized protein BKA67DRAFT_662099 [Truncatella angustata]KAH6649185.1 hypothetical protein BKA67DRAFT_662099 [Truncatella angustata]
MLGVHEAIDPSTYSEVYPANPNSRIKEIADLMTEWYQPFIDMIYIKAEHVVFPSHQYLKLDITKPAAYGLAKDVVDLNQMLPYYITEPEWNFGSDHGEFLKLLAGDGGTTDWGDESGPYIRPWHAPLSQLGNHGSVMVLDTRNYRMWRIGQLDSLGSTQDPALQGQPFMGSGLKNMNDLEGYPSRAAPEFIQDMISRFRGLEWIPGGLPIMSNAGEIIQQQIHLVDATYKLQTKLYADKWEEEKLQGQILITECNLQPMQAWDENQAKLRVNLDFRTTDLAGLRTRTGSYDGPDERAEREVCKAKQAAIGLSKEAWKALAKVNEKWENGDWKDRWSILGSGTTIIDVRTLVCEDSSWPELQKSIVYALEKNEERSWKGKRLWRNDDGRVAMVLEY